MLTRGTWSSHAAFLSLSFEGHRKWEVLRGPRQGWTPVPVVHDLLVSLLSKHGSQTGKWDLGTSATPRMVVGWMCVCHSVGKLLGWWGLCSCWGWGGLVCEQSVPGKRSNLRGISPNDLLVARQQRSAQPSRLYNMSSQHDPQGITNGPTLGRVHWDFSVTFGT